MNTITNLVISFVVFLVSSLLSFVSYAKAPLIFGAVIGALILGFNPVYASEVGFFSPDVVEVCRPYGSISLEECSVIVEGIRFQRIVGILAFVSIFVLLIPAILWHDHKEKVARRSTYQVELDTAIKRYQDSLK